MRWYERLYVGEKAQKRRHTIIRSIRKNEASGYYVLTPPSNEKNILDMYPMFTLCQPYYGEHEPYIIGVAADYGDAARLAGHIIEEMYRRTGAFRLEEFLSQRAK